MSTWYERHVLPYLIDWGCGLPLATRQRQTLVPRAYGRVLEVGVGTGLNLRHYDRQRVRSLTVLDPAESLHRLARQRAERAGLPVELLGLSAERIPLPDQCFDTVVMTWTLCSIPEPRPPCAKCAACWHRKGNCFSASTDCRRNPQYNAGSAAWNPGGAPAPPAAT